MSTKMNESKATKKAQAIALKQTHRDTANGVRATVKVSFIALLGATLNAIVEATRRECSGRINADVAERIGKDAGKVEVIKLVKGKKTIVYVNDPLMGTLYSTMGVMAACGFATGDVAAMLLEQGIITERAVISSDGLEDLTIRAKAMARNRQLIRTLAQHGVITEAQMVMALDHKGLRTMLLSKTSADNFTRTMVSKATGAKVTTAMVDAIREKLATLRALTITDRKANVMSKKEFHKLTLVDFTAIILPDAPSVDAVPPVVPDAPSVDAVPPVVPVELLSVPPVVANQTGASV